MRLFLFLISFMFILTAVAFADATAAAGGSIWETIAVAVFTACGGAITAFFGWLATKGTAWLKKNTALLSAAAEDAIQARIVGMVTIVARETMQTYVNEMAKANEDGKLTDAEKKTAFEKTFNRSVELLKAQGIETGREMLTAIIEAVVNKLKGEKNAPGDSPTPS